MSRQTERKEKEEKGKERTGRREGGGGGAERGESGRERAPVLGPPHPHPCPVAGEHPRVASPHRGGVRGSQGGGTLGKAPQDGQDSNLEADCLWTSRNSEGLGPVLSGEPWTVAANTGILGNT